MTEPQRGDAITSSMRLVRPLGAGGMGQVWIAWHDGLRCEVVVKLITSELAKSGEAVARFSREAAAASQVRSPHVVQIFDHGVTAAGQPYIAMELLEGESLRARLDRERVLSISDVVTIVSQCGKALMRAHERGVIHRDIKPDNVFLTDMGAGEIFVKLLDFGIAKAKDGDLVATTTGAVLGSPYYMSPEQVLGSKAIDLRSDLWSLAVMTFEALVGRRPFEAETIGALSIAICHGPTPVPSTMAPGLPPAFDSWFAKACAREPAARFGSAKELADSLATALAGHAQVAASPPRIALAATMPMTTTAGIGGVTVPPEPSAGWQRWAIVGGVVVLGALGGVAAWTLSRGKSSRVDETQPSSAHAPLASKAKSEVEPPPSPSVSAAAALSGSSKGPGLAAPTAKTTTTEPAKASTKSTSTEPATSLKPAPSASSEPTKKTSKPPAGVQDPNIF